jgi:NAD(P) transhydrogenase subunit beta
MPAEQIIEIAYFVAAVLFILGLKLLASPQSARRGMHLAELGMVIAIGGTLLDHHIITFTWIAIGAAIGAVAGIVIAVWTPMTAMPQRTALSHAFGAAAAALVGISHYYTEGANLPGGSMVALGIEVMLGSLTFTGSMVAFSKLQGWLPGMPMTFKGQNVFNMLLLAGIVTATVWVIASPASSTLFYVMVGLALAFGVLFVMPIGAADMPVVIALLNSYAGLAGAATGFALDNKILVIAGTLDGASGLILSILMCRAMNRPITNVLFGAFGKAPEAASDRGVQGNVHSMTADQAAELLAGSESVVVVPGYGMAVSQAQHAVKDLADVLGERGIDVRYAVHPVAGRMPGHMNVLLAEAGVPYDKLFDMEQINDDFPRVDVAIVIGANDVVNPAARNNKASPIYGMPILNVDKAKSVLVLKRSMATGFAGIENELFYMPNCMMVFGDARKTVGEFSTALKQRAKAA